MLKKEDWYFSVADVIEALTDSQNPRKYWSVLKTRLKKEGSELATNCSQLKLQSSSGTIFFLIIKAYSKCLFKKLKGSNLFATFLHCLLNSFLVSNY